MKPVSAVPASILAAVALSAATSAQSQRPRFLTPTQMPAPVNAAGSSSYSMALSADGLQAMVETDRAGGRGGHDLLLLRRASTTAGFASYGPMGFCEDHDEGGGIWVGAVTVMFSSNRPGGAGGYDLYLANGITIIGSPTGLNSPWDDTDPCITSDGLEFFFTSNRPGSLGGRSIWSATRASVNDPWGSPVTIAAIDSANHEQSPSITDDGLYLFFASDRSGSFDIYAAARATRQAPFAAPVRVAELSGPNQDIGIRIGPQGSVAVVTVLVNGRAVILSAARNTAPTLPALAASDPITPGDLLTATLRSAPGSLGILLLGAPMPPVDVGIGLLEVNPTLMVVLDVGLQGLDGVRLVQTLLPQDPHLSGAGLALQALSGPATDLRLTNAVLRVVQ